MRLDLHKRFILGLALLTMVVFSQSFFDQALPPEKSKVLPVASDYIPNSTFSIFQTPSPPPVDSIPKEKPLDATTVRAEKQLKQANVQAFLESEFWLLIDLPDGNSKAIPNPLTQGRLQKELAATPGKKDLLVITLGKLVLWRANKNSLTKLMDQLEKAGKESGFKKVIFHGSHSLGILILRE